MIVNRKELIARLDDFARSGHGIVMGEPGVGKTHSIVALHDLWEAAGVPHQVISVDRLGSVTEAEVKSVLGLDIDLVDHIADYFKARGPGVVVFDGFDSARNEDARARVLTLIRRAIETSSKRWTVLVTVRLFDASRSQSLRELFRDPASTPPYKGIGIGDTRSFQIPKLTDAEVLDAVNQIPGLTDILPNTTVAFRELLRVPFNLWLVLQILTSDGAASGLSAVASEVQLLGLYWARRVRGTDHADETTQLLSTLVARMVTTHSLSVRRDELYDIAFASFWNELLSSGVIEEVGTAQQRFAFSHNILFDYAVSILMMDDDPGSMHDFIAADFGRPLFLRPSVDYYYTRLWYDDREAFWRSLWAALDSDDAHVRLIGRIVPPMVIVREARMLADLDPAFLAVDQSSGQGDELLLRIFQALGLARWTNPVLWASVCAEAALRPRRSFAWNLITIATQIGESVDPLPEDLRVELGRVGRRMLRWALETRQKERYPVIDGVGALWAVPLVARTFATDAVESDELLRRVVRLLEEPGFSIEYLSRLSDSVGFLAKPAPTLTADIYRAVFAHVETSDEETAFGSPILPLRSTRRQDFGMCEYSLGRAFPEFLDAALAQATEAALDAFSGYVVRDRVLPYLREGKTVRDLTYRLSFRGRSLDVVADHGAIWLDIAHPDEALRIAHQVLERLQKAVSVADENSVETVLNAFSTHARVQSAWVLLLRTATSEPTSLGPRLAEIALSPDLQRGSYHEIANFVSATAAHWIPEMRDQYETQLDDMYRRADPSDAENVERRLADILMTALPKDVVRSTSLRARREELEATDKVPKNEPPFRMQTNWSSYSHEDWLEEQGVDVEAEQNRPLIDVANSLEELARPWNNERPPAEAIDAIAELIVKAEGQLAESRDAAPDVAQMVKTRVASAAQRIAKAKGSIPEPALRVARAALLTAAREPLTIDEEHLDRAFDMPSWSPIPQTEAAQGLPWLVVREADEEVLDAIESLAESREPSVRFLVATELFRLRGNAPDRFWRIVGKLSEREESRGVLTGLLQSLGMINRVDAPRIASVLQTLGKRGLIPDERSQYADAYVRLLAWLAFNIEEEWSLAELQRLARMEEPQAAATKRLVFEALSIVTPDYLRNPRVEPMARRATKWIRSVMEGIGQVTPKLSNKDVSAEFGKEIYGIVDDIAARLYYNLRPGETNKGNVRLEDIEEYFQTIRPIVDDVISFGKREGAALIAHTAHHLMQLLHIGLPLDPPGILHLAAEVVTSSERAGYNLDSMAVREIVDIAEEVLADYRSHITGGQSLEDFVRLVDSFANAGWPEALRLVWRLDEIFR
jgi:hypothetical protein